MFNDYPASILLACKIEILEKWRKRRRLPWYDGNKKKYGNDKKIVQCPVCPKRENLKNTILICMDLSRLTRR